MMNEQLADPTLRVCSSRETQSAMNCSVLPERGCPHCTITGGTGEVSTTASVRSV